MNRNLEVSYLYRDGCNNKKHQSVVIARACKFFCVTTLSKMTGNPVIELDDKLIQCGFPVADRPRPFL